MIECTFELNDKPISMFKIGARSFPAFSGLGSHLNRRSAVCSPNLGPIPPGRYYILDRQTGGRLGPLLDRIKGRQDWLALYADDGRIDDYTFCNRVQRGSFRLHPSGRAGISQGCIVIHSQADFYRLRALLNCHRPVAIPDLGIQAYGKVVVK
ncbi:DUF2778 domain-containing protein [Ralstonia solanacearum]|uniref:DUF2778 domain-containing protein n=1 Tax=Ralstonia nicotianae TaxID=3037696 RepID=A0ABX7ZPV7_9RALS|nr:MULTISPECIES: DUF2778 domain-containing protein [Ralstonia solanacearum species complex]AOE90738.1 hypothetical protein LBM341_02472 [Ralstonia solanacearum]AXV68331.1 DUF2778 domain-containing protein [Ralstonia solanacearum]AXV94691.1 DUF2778 domain-containing protein [Ralstonia solanacearum]AXV99903.1 DUF2778 domain-containing protein [Ralstonia solanacearum]AXW09483.1 DUF2778 domain-containing protein [Ralstonia solanacearum]